MWRQVASVSLNRLQRTTAAALAQRSLAIKVTKTKGSGSKHSNSKQPSIKGEHVNLSSSNKSASGSSAGGRAFNNSKANPKAMTMPDNEKEMELQKLQYAVRVHHQHANYAAALADSQTLLTKTKEHFGKNHPATASAYNNLGLMHKLMGQWAEAKQQYFDSLRIYEIVVGKDHASYAAALHNLGVLYQSRVHLDETLGGMERLHLLEEASQYFQDAWGIRQAELGESHPYTISSRSNYGAALAAQLIKATPRQQKKASRLQKQRWDVAEEHLRQSLQQALDHPHGKSVESSRLKTLSAATAAQNLAVVLKLRGTRIVESRSEGSSGEGDNGSDNDNGGGSLEIIDDDAVAEANQLYKDVLEVRSVILGSAHPDVVATKFSQAELLEALGDIETANKIREEIMDSYGVTEKTESEAESSTKDS